MTQSIFSQPPLRNCLYLCRLVSQTGRKYTCCPFSHSVPIRVNVKHVLQERPLFFLPWKVKAVVRPYPGTGPSLSRHWPVLKYRFWGRFRYRLHQCAFGCLSFLSFRSFSCLVAFCFWPFSLFILPPLSPIVFLLC